jgi:hypothetical protein
MRLTTSATMDVRYSFTSQFLKAAALFVRKARDIESVPPGTITEEIKCEYRAYVSTAIMQCAAALETEAHEISCYGPGAYLGSDGIDHKAQSFLLPLVDIIDSQDTLTRYELILHLLGKREIPRGAEPFQSAALVVRLRNELIHYKSRLGSQMNANKLFATLAAKNHRPSPFSDPSMNFFPHRCLSADCGEWAVISTYAYLNEVYASLGIASRYCDSSQISPEQSVA